MGTRCCLWVAEGMSGLTLFSPWSPVLSSGRMQCLLLARHFTCFIAFNSHNNPMCPHYLYFINEENWSLKVMYLFKVIKLGNDSPRLKLTWNPSPCSNNHTRIICMALNIGKVDTVPRVYWSCFQWITCLGLSLFYLGIHSFFNQSNWALYMLTMYHICCT